MTGTIEPATVAAVQAAPVFVDLDATVDKACDLIGEAARHGARLVVFPEAFVPTIFNSLLYLTPDGRVAGCHRKVMPTGGERTVWGTGDGSTLNVFEKSFGRLGGLLCWEKYMPLARAAMYAQRVDVYLAPTWDNADTWIATLRHIAKEGRTFVIGTNSCMRAADIGRDLPGRDDLCRREFDPVGHYARPDIFHLDVDARPKLATTFTA